MNYNFNMSKIYMNKLEAKIEDLEKENKNLKEDFKRHIDRINELTNRIDKAIEYIEQEVNNCDIYCDGVTPQHCPDIKKILDILEGSDKE